MPGMMGMGGGGGGMSPLGKLGMRGQQQQQPQQEPVSPYMQASAMYTTADQMSGGGVNIPATGQGNSQLQQLLQQWRMNQASNAAG